jgi:hypothetical protein
VADEGAAIGFPPGFQLFQLEGMEGLNTKAQRPAIKDQQFAWIENFYPIGEANARTLWGVGTTKYTASGMLTIVSYGFYNIGAVAYGIAFLSDGSADQFQLSNGTVTNVGPAGTFWTTNNPTPTFAQFSNSGIVIVSTSGAVAADSYWAWDGALHKPGDATSPVWLNGGTPTAMPTGVAGTAIEIFLGRVWIVNGTNILTSAPSNGADFSTGSGGLTKPNQDSTLRVKYTAIRAANGYLYVFGDSECAYITNVQTSTVPTTTYQYTVIDPQIGTPWRDSVLAFGRSILFANTNGIYALYGSTANKISDELDGVWNDTVADFTTLVPSAGASTIYGIKTFIISVRTTPPGETSMRDIVCLFDGKKWFAGSQVPPPVLLAPQETDSHLACYGCDTTHIYETFAVASDTLDKKMVSKLWGGQYGFVARKQALRFYSEVQALGNTTASITGTLDTEAGSSGITATFAQDITFVNASNLPIQFQNSSNHYLFFQTNATISADNLNGSGLLLGFTITTTSPDFVFLRGGIGYTNLTALF